jgi:site-specific DNA recombinase
MLGEEATSMSESFSAAFYARVSTEDRQSPEDSIAWQRAAATALIDAHGGRVVAEYLDVGVSRSLPWSRRPEAARLLADCARKDRHFEAVVIGEPQRAFAGTQYGLTAPLLWHYGVELWVPEVGGRVDPDSEAHDLVMSLFGGLSKAERARIQRRVRAAMTTMARTGGRYLGGRPPYGYRLTPASAHPNAEKARVGATLNRLEADPQTAPVVQRIFRERLAGAGYTSIARGLNRDGLLSPAGYDRGRNTHRDPRGWADSAVRAVLANARYTGHEVWARQRREYELLDPAIPADGHVRRMRWNPSREWIWSPEPTHEPLVTREEWEAAQAPVHASSRAPKTASRTYLLRGRVRCGVCDRRMHGETRSAKHSPRVYYRCPVRNQYPGAAADHVSDVFVPEGPLLRSLDEWIAELFAPEHVEKTARALVEAANVTDAPEAISVAQERLAAARRKLRQYRAALDDGADPATVSVWITQAAAEERAAQAELDSIRQAAPPTLTVQDVVAAVTDLGGLVTVLQGAEPKERAELYAALGVEITYQPDPRTAVLAVEPQALGQARVGGGT